MSEAVITLSDVHRSFHSGEDELHVLQGASLTIGQGEAIALVAPSGAGKSTLLQISGLLEKPDAGSITIGGVDAASADDATRTRLRREEIGFVYQFHHLLPEFSALENVVLPQMINGLSKSDAMERATQLLAYLRIDHRAEHRPAELSGGEQQRVAIARAVANAPSLLLADEPTGNLDPQTSDYVFDALMSLVRASGLALLVATHNLELAARMDHTITLEDGKIVPYRG